MNARRRRAKPVAVGGTPAAIAALAALAVVVPASSPAAEPPKPELALFVSYRITTVPHAAGGLYRATGTFSVTGRIADSGTASSTFRLTARGPDTIRGVETVRGKRGRVVVRFQASAQPVGKRKLNERPGPERVIGIGAWRIASATRAYEALRGRTGTMGYTIDFRRRTTASLHTLR